MRTLEEYVQNEANMEQLEKLCDITLGKFQVIWSYAYEKKKEKQAKFMGDEKDAKQARRAQDTIMFTVNNL